MELRFSNPGFQYSIDSIMLFHMGEVDGAWQQALFELYPQIEKRHFAQLPPERRNEYLFETLRYVYEREQASISQKANRYTWHWQANKRQIVAAISDAFQLDCSERYEDIVGNITLNPICPRFLERREFDVFYQNSERGALGVALHEIIHFVWFDVWQRHFGDSASEYETPHLKWVLSEMVVDPIMRADIRLSGINPYFQQGCVYECFYRMTVEGAPLLETLHNMHKNMNIASFMEQAYAYCLKHEGEIRRQM